MAFAPAGEARTASVEAFDPDRTPIFGILGGGGNDGVWLDPTIISLKSGVVDGPSIDASQLGAGCAGNITVQPDVAMYWLQDDDVETLRIFLLATRDAHELYRRYGDFQQIPAPERLMARRRT